MDYRRYKCTLTSCAAHIRVGIAVTDAAENERVLTVERNRVTVCTGVAALGTHRARFIFLNRHRNTAHNVYNFFECIEVDRNIVVNSNFVVVFYRLDKAVRAAVGIRSIDLCVLIAVFCVDISVRITHERRKKQLLSLFVHREHNYRVGIASARVNPYEQKVYNVLAFHERSIGRAFSPVFEYSRKVGAVAKLRKSLNRRLVVFVLPAVTVVIDMSVVNKIRSVVKHILRKIKIEDYSGKYRAERDEHRNY